MVTLRLTALVVLMALTAASYACGGDDGGSPTSPTATAALGTARPVTAIVPQRTPAEGTPAAGCLFNQRLRATGDNAEMFPFGGLDRTYILRIPPRYDGVSPLPLVLNLHGFGSNARQQANYSRFPAKADEADFILLSPDAAGTPPMWNILNLAGGADDVAFIGALLDKLTSELCIDPARIYAAGISNGSAFAQRLHCALPERIAGVAAVAALVLPFQCGATTAVPVIAFHGTADACVPFEGGRTTCGRGGLPVPSVETSAANWAKHNGCNPEPARAQVTEHVRSIAYGACTDGVAVVVYVVEGGGHTWPGSPDVARLGATTREIDATDLIWEFFEE